MLSDHRIHISMRVGRGVVTIAMMLWIPTYAFAASSSASVDPDLKRQILSAANEREFFARLGTNLTMPGVSVNLKELIQSYAQSRSPGITAQAITNIFSNRRQSIKSLRWTRVVTDTTTSALTSFVLEEHAVAGEKTWRKWSFTDAGLRRGTIVTTRPTIIPPGGWQVLSYDGKYVRSWESQSDGEPLGQLFPPKSDSPSLFFTTAELQAQALLMDSSHLRSPSNWPYVDLVALTMSPRVVVSRRSGTSGHPDLIVVASMNWSAMLDPEKGYAVVRLESYDFGKRKDGRFLPPVLVYRRDLSGYRSYDHAIWLPSASHQWWYDGGKITGETSFEYRDIQVNQPIPAKLFTDIFPPKAYVNDFRSASVAAHPTTQNFEAIQAALSRAPVLQGEGGLSRRIVYFGVAFVGAVLVVLVLWILARRRRPREEP